jgi:methionyl-tRNA synthetase
MRPPFYITTAIPYVNAPPHIGHALEFVEADVVARSRRLAGDEVYFLSGSDENAIKNVQAAEEARVPVERLVEKNSGLFRDLLKVLNVSNDQFIRTTEPRHVRGAQALWRATDPKDIYRKTYRGLYCVGCELFYRPEELNERGECREHPGKKLEVVEEENYFFRLSRYTDRLRELIAKDELRIVPQTRKNEMLSLIEGGLEDFSASRPVARSKGWGVPVPGDDTQTIYVWYDALANYITALGYPDANAALFEKFWKGNGRKLHVIGKGISRFHAIYWPAMLMSAGLPLPNEEFIHGYATVEGEKISKTLGNVVDPFAVVEKYGVDPVRYYLLREIPAYEDGDFSVKKFEERYHADLANGLGNFVARVTTLGERLKGKEIDFEKDMDPVLAEAIAGAKRTVASKLADYRFHEALAAVWGLISAGDSYVNEKKPWENPDEKLLFSLVATADNIAALLAPFLPETSERITKRITWQDHTVLVSRGPVLFPRLQK